MTIDGDWREIVRLGARGDGVTAEGRFVPGAVPGDQVRFDPPAIIAGPGHAVPPCRHFPDCGGCQLQHFVDDAYARWAASRIVAALDAANVAVGQIETTSLSPTHSRRRAALRAVKRDGRLALGFNAEASHRVVDLHECWILKRELFALIAPLRQLLGAVLRDGQGAGVTLTASETGVDVLLANVAARRFADLERLTAFAQAHDLARLSIEGPEGVETIVEARAPTITFGGSPVALPPAAFLQATREGEAALVAAVQAALAGADRIADLFAGLGTFALPLAAGGARVLAVEGAKNAADALGGAVRSHGARVLVEHRDLFRRPLTAPELAHFEAVVFDPPRTGAVAQVTELARSALTRVVAVSCNPNTFARDAATLTQAGFRLERLWPVAQFRWSVHLELVASFVR